VVAIPSRVFYDSDIDRYVRFAFCKRPEVLAEALDRLGKMSA
jgi:N-succinyldiaminopimelate aminotransferase